jgi:hypothetical protein
MIRPLFILAIVLSIPGCGLDVLEGKPSSFQAEVERREAITLPAVDAPAVAEVPLAEPVAEADPVAVEPPAAEPPAPVVVPVAVCVPRWRVLDCDADGHEVWL